MCSTSNGYAKDFEKVKIRENSHSLFWMKLIIFGLIFLIVIANAFADCTYLNNGSIEAYYSFDSDYDDYTTNWDGTANGGISNPQTNCVINGCAEGDGVDGQISIGDTTFWDSRQTPISFAFWVRNDDTSIAEAMMLDKISGSGYDIRFTGTNNRQFTLLFTDTNGKALACKSTNQVTQGDWTHLVMTYDGTPTDCSHMEFYIDGSSEVLIEQQANSDTDDISNNANAEWFSRPGATAYDLDGRIDEALIFGGVLSQTDVNNLYNSNSGCNPTASVGGVLTFETDIVNNSKIGLIDYPTKIYPFNINGTCTGCNNDLGNVSIYLNGTLNHTTNNINLSLNTQINFSFEGLESLYEFNITVINLNASDEIIYNLVFDSFEPEIDISTNFINNTHYYMNYDEIKFNITATDTNLFAINFTLRKEGVVLEENFTDNIIGTSFQYNYSNISGELQWGNFTIEFTAVDDHNPVEKEHEKITDDTIRQGYSAFYFGEDVITFESDDINYFNIVSEDNHYKLLIDVKNKVDASIFISSNKKIDYRSNSIHKAHFVILEMLKYIDFDSQDINIKSIEKISDYRYKIKLDFEKNEIETNSIGDLNIKNKIWNFLITDSISIQAIADNIPDGTLDSPTYVTVHETVFNTSQDETFLVLSSANLYKATLPQTSTIWGKILVDDVEIVEQKLRSVSSTADIGVSGFSPFLFNVTSGSHNISFQLRDDGNGQIGYSNVDLLLLKVRSNKNTTGNTILQTIVNSTTANGFTKVNENIFTSPFPSNVFYVMDLGVEATTTSTIDVRMVDVDDLISSPIGTRYLETAGDSGKMVMSYIDEDERLIHNHSIEMQVSAGTGTINGTIFGGNFIDNLNNRVQHSYLSNPNTNKTNTLTLNAGENTIVNFDHKVFNGTQLVIIAYASFQSLSGLQTPSITTKLDGLECSTKERYLSDNNDIANAYIYSICNSLTPNVNVTLELTLTVPTGEQVSLLDESLLVFETVPFDISDINQPPNVTFAQNLQSSIAESSNSVAIVQLIDFDSPQNNLTAEWYVNNLNVFTEIETINDNIINTTFTLSASNYQSGDTVYLNVTAFDGINTVRITSVTSNVTSSAGLSTQLLEDINMSNYLIFNESEQQTTILTNIFEVIDMIWIVLFILAFLLVGALIKQFWLWGFSALGTIILGGTFMVRADSGYNLTMAIAFITLGIIMIVVTVLMTLYTTFKATTEQEEHFDYIMYNR